MLFRLVRPVRRKGSSLHQFTQRIPADVIGRAAGLRLSVPLGDGEVHHLTITAKARDVRFSLRTRDPSTAKVRQAAAVGFLEGVWRSLRAEGPVALTHRQATALAGELYRAWADGEGRERTTTIEIDLTPGPDGKRAWRPASLSPREEETAFAAAAARLRWQEEGQDPAALEETFGPLVDRLLLARAIRAVNAPSRTLLLDAFARALREALEARSRNAGGDYSPDSKASRYPTWEPPSPVPEPIHAAGRKVSLSALVEGWWTEGKATGLKPSTYLNYSKSVGLLSRFLGHDDAARVTPEDLLRFKDHRLATINLRSGLPVSAKTVKDGDFAAFKRVFGWAVSNRKLPANPAAGLTIKLGKKAKVRSKSLSDAEAVVLLRAALRADPAVDTPRTAAAKRWVPWLMAYTGARVGELAQLRREDVRQEGGVWVVRITPEAGTVKTNEAREVPLHPHLVEQGFPAFATGAPAGHLFLKLGPGGDVRGPLRGLKNRLAEMARKVVPDPNVAPNHGWRHRFKTVGIEAGIAPRILDAIQGHAPRTAGDAYGEVSVRAMAEAVTKLPRYTLGDFKACIKLPASRWPSNSAPAGADSQSESDYDEPCSTRS